MRLLENMTEVTFIQPSRGMNDVENPNEPGDTPLRRDAGQAVGQSADTNLSSASRICAAGFPTRGKLGLRKLQSIGCAVTPFPSTDALPCGSYGSCVLPRTLCNLYWRVGRCGQYDRDGAS
jgi:hypothetical protein